MVFGTRPVRSNFGKLDAISFNLLRDFEEVNVYSLKGVLFERKPFIYLIPFIPIGKNYLGINKAFFIS
tara:strand:+ start:2619 stop:2822 length:204 start_codon:yes stop_codon:yes gene_type:complete